MAALEQLAGPVSVLPLSKLLRTSGYVGPDRRDHASRERLVLRVKNEFDEMPGLQLTFAQAKLLFGLEPGCCERVLGGLLQSGFLVRTRTGLYGRRDMNV